MKTKNRLLIIDPQNDFCAKNGALAVPRGEEDMKNLAKFIDNFGDNLEDIHVSLDSHQIIHIANPVAWIDNKGNHPNVFTTITKDDVLNGRWRAARAGFQKRFEDYVSQLESNGRYQLVQWPAHTLIGTPGHNVFPCVAESLQNWEIKHFAKVDYHTKGNNPFTEHYSIIKSDVPDPSDPTTKINTVLIDTLKEADFIFAGGEALSHCYASSLRDIASEFGEENIKKFVLLEDTTSSVPGFEHLGDDFIKEFVSKGMRVASTKDF